MALFVGREEDGWIVALLLLVGREKDGWIVGLLVGRERAGRLGWWRC